MKPTDNPFEQKRLAGVYKRFHGRSMNYDLSAIPNVDHCHITGLTRELEEVQCTVRLCTDGTYSVFLYKSGIDHLGPLNRSGSFADQWIWNALIAWRLSWE